MVCFNFTFIFFFSSRRRHTRCALVTGVQTCALPISYQKRAPFVIDYVIDLARRSRHRIMVRLVKGAYWDSEIKQAQIDGLEGYPVYTRKVYTDVAYLACARKLLGAPEAVYQIGRAHV